MTYPPLAAAVVVALAITGCGGDGGGQGPPEPEPEPEPAAWQRVDPGGATRTARGDPYAFWVRRADPRRLLLYFQEGGGCFTYEMCAPGSTWFDDSVDASDEPTAAGGILDGSDRRNPFREHTIVYIPSATGDLHWGDARVTYRQGGDSVAVEHRGFVNATAAVRWAFRNVPDPQSVLVTGCSAGSVGSAALVPFVIRHYRHARVAQLGDSLAFVFHRPMDLSDIRAYANMPRWIPAVRALRPGRHTMADYYAAIGRYYRNAAFAQFNYAGDAVQRDFYAAAGGDPSGFEADLRASLRAIHATVPNFRSFTASGVDHCVLPTERFHTEHRAGLTVRDWTARLAAGREVRDVG